ncbi:hypothetical protein O181_055560 [Austropuccinia psidii MF-1]|uniref:Uncharacterized protein n=1 Tax=Austropuccinia psidii MF-1 TaxID=1389203 RepID=A0A9Q3HVC6_9BASI|nr:hypothetical protein [Austropuccinia psidii MF-1]
MSFHGYPRNNIDNENNPSEISQILHTQNQCINELKTQLQHRDQEVESLLAQVMNLQVQFRQSAKPSKNSKGKSSKKTTKVNNSPATPSANRKKTNQGSSKNKSKSLSQKRALTPSENTKKRPNQLSMNDIPEGFKPTKNAFFAHIRIMWGLIYEKSVPVAPDPTLLKEFYNRFDDVEEIQEVTNSSTSIKLIPETDVITLRGTKPGRKKVGRAIVNVQEFFILYIQVLLAKLGIRRWAPSLDEPIDTLYNEACRISAIKTFRQVAVGGAYQYMNINLRFLNNLMLLEATYNHFVHYLQAKIYKREMKESGSYQKALEKGAISKNRQRLCKTRYKFGVAENFPKRYLKILAEIDCHSDDEFVEEMKGYVIKALPYRSKNATTFMRRVDEEIEKASSNQGKRSQKHQRIITEHPPTTRFGRAPKGLPIDFFDYQWFNACSPAQKTIHAETMKVAFLPDAIQSIRGIQHPDEKLSDKRFSEKYWEQVTQEYDLSHEIAVDEDDDESSSDYEDVESDSSIDMDVSSDEEEEDSEDEGNNKMDEDESMEDSEAVRPSNVEYGFDWENWK